MIRTSHDTTSSSPQEGGSETNHRTGSCWIDVSVPLHNAMVHWPSDPPFSIKRVKDMKHGDTANLSVISMGAHSGTHIDAPLHFIQ